MEKTNILAFCYNTIPSAIVGVIKPLQFLQNKKFINFVYKESRRVTEEDILQSDVVISIRGAETIDVNNIRKAKAWGKYVIYYLDDDLLNIGELSRSYNKSYFQKPNIRANVNIIMNTSHCLWTTNDNIGDRYKNIFEKISVTGAPAVLLEYNKNSKAITDNDVLTIGFAGGKDHSSFIEKMLLKPLLTVLDKYKPKVKIEICGLNPHTYRNKPVTYSPYMRNYDDYIKYMISRKWDIAVAPLKASNFHCCKYFNKFLEYGSIHAAGIYSDVEPFTYIVKDNENGLLVNNTIEDWTNGLISLIEDSDMRNRIKKNAYDLLVRDFSIENIAEEIMKSMPYLITYKSVQK